MSTKAGTGSRCFFLLLFYNILLLERTLYQPPLVDIFFLQASMNHLNKYLSLFVRYSYVVNMLAGAVYTFGFISMTPQLFINYKLKSVAHLPWRMMTYKVWCRYFFFQTPPRFFHHLFSLIFFPLHGLEKPSYFCRRLTLS